MIESADSYFNEKISSYFNKYKITVNEHSQKYLISLLKKFISTNEIKYKTLFDIYKKCVEDQNISNYQYLGDHSLYISGVFPDSLNRSLVNLDYYVQMGQLGYHQAANLSLNTSNKKLYIEMAKNFKIYMNSFYSISQESFVKDKFALYNQYLLTENPEIYKELLKSGVIPIKR